MTTMSSLLNDLETKAGLGAQARPLFGELLRLVTGGTGGIAGFLERARTSGLGSEIASWTSGAATTLPTQSVERLLGPATIGNLANKLGLSTSVIAMAGGLVLPRMIGALAPNGVASPHLSPEVADFLAPEHGTVRTAEQVAPMSLQVVHDEPHMKSWLWPILGCLAILGIGSYFFANRAPTINTPTIAPVAAAVPAPPAPLLPPRLALSNDDGTITYSGLVHDENTRNSLLNSLKSVFGANRIKGNIAVDASRGAPPWLVNFDAALENLKMPGIEAVFDGNSINVGGLISAADREQISASMKGALGGGNLVFGTLPNETTDLASGANLKTTYALTALHAGFSAKDLVGILNQSMINFPTNAADIPASTMTMLQDAASEIRQLPPGTTIEIAGYTDNTGDPAANLALSQQRADAVRNWFVHAGVSPSTLVAKGYGNANPIASNDMQQGRFHNRRIEYHVLNQQP